VALPNGIDYRDADGRNGRSIGFAVDLRLVARYEAAFASTGPAAQIAYAELDQMTGETTEEGQPLPACRLGSGVVLLCERGNE